MTTSFESLGLREELLRAVTESGYTQTTDIQALAIPPLLEGRDVLGQAQTGTGKTAAFTLPMLHKLDFSSGLAQALILTPTRELAMQVANSVWVYGQHLRVRVVPIYGGQSYTRQQKRLEKGVDVIVGTPGRMLDLIQKGMMDVSQVKYLILDEADEMLKMGFIDDVETILNATPTTRQTALFSATLPETIRSLARKYLNNPLTTHVPQSEMTVQQIEQCYVLVHSDSKIPALSRLLEAEKMQSALIFTRTRARANELSEALLQRGFNVDVISGDLLQDAREAVLRRFRNGDLPILVATDVVARGVDIPDVSHVFNYDIPLDQEDYVHRIGRTGRAGRAGKSITLVAPEERRKMRMIEHFIQQRLTEIKLPKLEDIRATRNARFLEKLEVILEAGSMELGMETVSELIAAGYDMTEVAAAAIQIARASEQNRPIDHVKTLREENLRGGYDRDRRGGDRRERGNGDFRRDRSNGERREGGRDSGKWASNGDRPQRRSSSEREPGMVRLILNMGRNDGVKPGDIVGTIAANAGIPGKAIGAINIQAEQTYVDVQDQHVDRVLSKMQSDGRMKGKSVKLTRA